MKMKRLLTLLLALDLIAVTLQGQDVKVTAAFDSTSIYIGDQIAYRITVDQPEGLNLALKPLKDTLCKNIEILAGPVTDTLKITDGRIKFESRYLVTSFDSGRYAVPPVYAEVSDASGIRRFYSDYSFLEVNRVKIAPQDTASKIFDIIGPYKAPVTFGEILPWLLLAAAAGLVIWGALILYRRLRKHKIVPEEVIIIEPAHIIAFRDLDKLKEEQLWQKGEIKQYYSRLTEIVRLYLENRFKVYSLEMTTSETLEELLKTGFKKDESYSRLKSVLNGADLVKFAKYKPDPSENENHFGDVWKFVDSTKVVEQTITEAVSKEKEEKRS
jgi:hypothetical protein